MRFACQVNALQAGVEYRVVQGRGAHREGVEVESVTARSLGVNWLIHRVEDAREPAADGDRLSSSYGRRLHQGRAGAATGVPDLLQW